MLNKTCWICGGKIKKEVVDKLDTHIAELGLSKRTYFSLRRYDIENVGQLLKLTINDLLLMRNIGTTTIKEIQEKVKEFGFTIEFGPEIKYHII